MFSQAASDGTLTLTVTFKLGTDANLAQQLVFRTGRCNASRLWRRVRATVALTTWRTRGRTLD
jgi:multidrug efflux pump subunit AcrB